jgi:hypothetical protein
VSKAIETTGKVKEGVKIFRIIKDVEVKIVPPKKIIQTNVLIRRLKKKKENTGFESTFCIRGYVYYPEEINIYLNIPSNVEEVEKILKNIRSFGTSDSLVWCKTITREEPPYDAIFATEKLERNDNRNVLIIPVKDISPKTKFEDINIYKKRGGKRNNLLRKFYIIPIHKQSEGKNWIVYDLV